MREVARALLAEAKDGNVQAAKEFLDRTLGKAIQPSVTLDNDHLRQFFVELYGEVPPESFVAEMRAEYAAEAEAFDEEAPDGTNT